MCADLDIVALRAVGWVNPMLNPLCPPLRAPSVRPFLRPGDAIAHVLENECVAVCLVPFQHSGGGGN
eukprot:2642563-Pleurochrysis_carterae.AAC.1